jgi:hypothetical protein
VQVDARNLDLRDPHDVGARTFHGARQDTVERLFIPCSARGSTGSDAAATLPTTRSSASTSARCNPRPTVEASRWSPRRTARATLEQRGVRCGDTIDCGVCHMAPFRDLDGKTLMLHHPRR